MSKTLPFLALASASAFVLSGCSSTAEQAVEPATTPETTAVVEGPTVVATTTILGSVVSDILVCALGTDDSATVLMPIGADPHDFQPSSEQVALMSSADLVVANGLFLEEGLVSVLESVKTEGATVIELAELLEPLPFAYESVKDDHDHGHSDEEGVEDEDEHAHGDFDPHFWLDMGRMAGASELIGSELALATGDDTFEQCGASVADDIRAAEVGVIETLSSIPTDRRVLVTDHDAFAYFADSYDFRVVGVVVPGGSTLADPSSKDLATLVATIRAENVPAVFANTAASSAVAEAIAAEAGGVDVVALFVGSVGGPGSGAETYIAMMHSNAALIAKALTD
jgi:zinc/manganese transport system substrate-binding protein